MRRWPLFVSLSIAVGCRESTVALPATAPDSAECAQPCDQAPTGNRPTAPRDRLAICGDGIVDPGEACDDGPNNADYEPGACRTTCVAPSCGDGVADPGEFCHGPRAVRNSGWPVLIDDITGEGHIDILWRDFDSALVSLAGLGDGRFTFAGRINNAAESWLVADVDGDGTKDVSAWSHSGASNVYLTLPSGQFVPHFGLEHADPQVTFRRIADINGDGRVDLAWLNGGTNELLFRRGNGDGTFGDASVMSFQRRKPIAFEVAQIDDSPAPDLLMYFGAPVRELLALRGREDGTFQIVWTHQFLHGQWRWTVRHDLNGDGRMDFIIGADRVLVLLAIGNGGFYARELDVLMQHGRLIDFDGDGKLDLVGTTNNGLVVLQGDGRRFGVPQVILPDAKENFSLVDIDADGRLDVQYTGGCGGDRTTIRLGTEAGFGEPSTFVLGERWPFLFDVDQDADLDWITNDGVVLENRGAGQFDLRRFDLPIRGPVAMAAGDFDGDGHVDLAAASDDGRSISVAAGLPNGRFSPWLEQYAVVASVLDVADVDNDGLSDLIIHGRDWWVARGSRGAGLLAPEPLDGPGRVIELTADQRPDRLHLDGGELIVRIQRSGGLITTATISSDPRRPRIPITDFLAVNIDDDVWMEIVVAYADGRLSSFDLLVSGAIAPLTTVETDLVNPQLRLTSRINGGAPRIIAYDDVRLMEVRSDSLDFTRVIDLGFASIHDVVEADVDTDGVPDIVFARAAPLGEPSPTQHHFGKLVFLRRKPDGSFEGPRSFGLLDNASAVVAGDYNGDGAVDFAVLEQMPTLPIIDGGCEGTGRVSVMLARP